MRKTSSAVNSILSFVLLVSFLIFSLLLVAPGAMHAQAVTAALRVGGNPYGIAVNAATNHIYVANANSNNVTVIDAATNNTVYVGTGLNPEAVAINPLTNKAYVANLDSGTVTVIDGTTFDTLTVSAGTSPDAIAVNPITNKIYVANRDSNNVTVIDGASNGATTINAGKTPRAIAINPVTNTIYVANRDSNNVTVINGATSATTTVKTGSLPVAIAVDPVTNQIYVANRSSNNVTVIDGATNNTATVSAGTTPRAIALNPVTNKIYVANRDSANVTVIDGATNSTTTVSAGTIPRSIAVNPVTNTIYVANRDSNSVTVINGATNATLTLTSPGGPRAVAINPVTNKIYVGNRGNNKVTVIDGSVNSATTVSTGNNPSAVAVNPATGNIYIANTDDNTVTVIDGVTNSALTVAVGTTPCAIAVNPVTNQIYVADQASDDVVVIDGATNTTTFVTVGATPAAIAVNPVTNQIYVADQDSNDVMVIDGATNNTVSVSVGTTPEAIVVNLVTNQIYVADQDSNDVTVIDGATNSTTTIPAGTSPSAIDINPVTNQIYVANQDSNNVTVIDGASTSTITVNAGLGPAAIAVNPVSNQIYVANQTSNDVTVIDGATNFTTAISVGTTPSAVAVNPVINQIYVTNQGSDAVTVLDGATNNTTIVNVGSSPGAVAVNLATQRIYVANAVDNDISVITPVAIQNIPLTAQVQGVSDSDTVAGLAIFGTTNPSPTFQATATSSYSPIAPAPDALYYQLDTVQTAWQSATASGPAGGNPADYSFSLSNVSPGVHTVYVYAAYGNEGTTEDSAIGAGSLEVGMLTAYTFAVLPGYSGPRTAYPVFSPAPGVYPSAQPVSLSDETSGAAIYYTLDGTIPTTSSMLYTGPVTVSQTETVKAIAVATGYSPSGVANGSYTIGYPPAATPTFSIEPGAYSTPQSVALADTTSGAVIYYTTNGSLPTTASTKYTAPITVTPPTTVKAIAYATGYSPSGIAKGVYTLPVADPPAFSPAPGNYTSPQTVTLTDDIPGAVIYYTTNGFTPTTASSQYTGPITVAVNPPTLLQAIAVATGYSQSAIASGFYAQPQADPPTFSPAPGYYASAQSVTLTDDTPGAVIYYTTNGGWPTTSSTPYTGPITATPPTTILAIAIASGYSPSGVAEGMYSLPQAATPTLSPWPGTYSTPQTVTMADTTPGAVIYYTTDGTMPATSSYRYAGPIVVTPPETILAIAVATGYSQSGLAGGTYMSPQAAEPRFWPRPGKYTTPQTITLSDTTPGAVIYYTTDGSLPTTSSTRYTGVFSVTPPTAVMAIAVANGYYPSSIADGVYKLPEMDKVTFSPPAGTYVTSQSVSLAQTYPGAVIYYTTDDSKPTASSTVYTGVIAVSEKTKIKAIAVANGCCQSAVASAVYDIVPRTNTPTFSIAPGTYCGQVSVALRKSNSGADIYYTLDGSTPSASSTLYTGKIVISETTTINAIAIAPTHLPSGVATGTFNDSCTLTLTSLPVNPVYGQAVTITAAVNSIQSLAGSVTLTVNGVTQSPVLTNASGQAALTLTRPAAGQYTIGGSFTGSGYFIQVQQPLIINVATATLTATALNKSRNYGSANPVFTGTLTGVLFGDGITASFSTGTVNTNSAGKYNIIPQLHDPNNKLSNYTQNIKDGTLTVNPLPLSATAANKTRGYWAADPVFTGAVTGALAADGITATYTTTAVQDSIVGKYLIVPQWSDPNNKIGNYAAVTHDGTLTITRASLVVTAANQTRVYEQPDPIFTGSITGNGVTSGALAADGISAAYTCPDTVASPVGSYRITPGLIDPNKRQSNYTVTYRTGVLAVTKAALKVTADNQSRQVGQPNPPLTGEVTGLVAGDPITITYTTTAKIMSPAGQYPITPGVAGPSKTLLNYTVTKVAGTLTVTQ